MFFKVLFTAFTILSLASHADQLFFKNPVLPHVIDKSERGIKSLRRDTEYIMSLRDDEILKRMPVQVPRIHNGCPNCRKGKKERDKHWDYEQPHCFGKVTMRLRVLRNSQNLSGSVMEMKKEFDKVGSGSVKVSIFEGANHKTASAQAKQVEGMYKWLFSHKKKK